jgi:hypothetical protein
MFFENIIRRMRWRGCVTRICIGKCPKNEWVFFSSLFQAKIGPRAHRFSTEQTHNPYWKPVFDLQSGLPLLGALPPDPRQGVTPWTPFFFVNKRDRYRYIFEKRGRFFSFSFRPPFLRDLSASPLSVSLRMGRPPGALASRSPRCVADLGMLRRRGDQSRKNGF